MNARLDSYDHLITILGIFMTSYRFSQAPKPLRSLSLCSAIFQSRDMLAAPALPQHIPAPPAKTDETHMLGTLALPIWRIFQSPR